MAQSTQFQPVITSNLSTIVADGDTVSSAVDLSGTTLAGILFPAEYDGASITLQASNSYSGSYVDVYDAAGTAFTITAGASRMVMIEPSKVAGIQYMKIETNIAQTGDTSFTLLTRPV